MSHAEARPARNVQIGCLLGALASLGILSFTSALYHRSPIVVPMDPFVVPPAADLATTPEPPTTPHGAPARLFSMVLTVAGARGVPVHILAGLTDDESSWDPFAVSPEGDCVGLLQLKIETANWCGAVDRFDAYANLDCGARYLFAQFERFGSWELAIVAFKAGPERIPDRIPAAAWAFAHRALLKAEAYR